MKSEVTIVATERLKWVKKVIVFLNFAFKDTIVEDLYIHQSFPEIPVAFALEVRFLKLSDNRGVDW